MPKDVYLTDYLQFHATKNGYKPALIFEAETLSWAALWAEVELFSSWILERVGNKKQSVISLLLTNSPEFVITYLGIVHAGHIAMPLDPAYKKLELDAIIKQLSPALTITDKRYRGQISELDVVMVDKPLKSPRTTLKPLRLAPEKQIASLTFTSGTTGQPKAAPYTHANHIWNIRVCSAVWAWTAQDTLLVSLPLSHWYGLVMGLSGMLYHGNTLYLQQQAFNPKETLSMLASGRISIFTHTPMAYMKILDSQTSSDYDLSPVRLLISGGGPMPPSIWKKFKEHFGVEIIETYGSSETGRIAANSLTRKVPGSPGKILAGVKLKLSSSGEILIKSPGVFPGYYHNARATSMTQSADGWWKTGDIGELEDGYLYLKGRAQEKIRKFGYTVSPRDVEWALLQNPKIKEVQVMGRQNPGQPNDQLIYFISGSLSEPELLDYCKQNLVFAWRPDKVVFMDSLPRTTAGKPSLRALRKMV